ncbi:DUF4023 domain-containing protein [Paenibacillus nasutitermitis]|uniref:DUF4023 domain-containing protein n=1 Tax=Paenibacillus nasutitermitis TaxID=1652958 RepID=A0A916YT37_9BACL|nr:DUF4023 domain-containing protein [Paenibacillus nasutitermitis]GGD59193.1 hypothetical protein GCM10010911_16270 [Paenibacillus nasutitermitis]
MDSTNDFVNKVKDTQAKQQKNKEHHGKGKESKNLPNVQHTNNP